MYIVFIVFLRRPILEEGPHRGCDHEGTASGHRACNRDHQDAWRFRRSIRNQDHHLETCAIKGRRTGWEPTWTSCDC